MSMIMGMRGFLSSSIGATSLGVTCAAALALSPALPAAAASARAERTDATGRVDEVAVPGSTRSLPLVPLSRERALGPAPEQGLYRVDVQHFSLVGVVWDDPGTELEGRVQVRNRSAATERWSGWQDVETHDEDDGADPGTGEGTSGRVRGATAPLWVGDSDGVDVRVLAGSGTTAKGRPGDPVPPLPSGLRLELVDPGDGAPPPDPPANGSLAQTDPTAAAYAADADLAPVGALEIPELNRRDTEREMSRLMGDSAGRKYIGPRPRIVTRHGWGADESLRKSGFAYTKKVKAVFVHHTASGNKSTCAQAPSVIRGIYRYHVKSMHWRDIGYNFLVDKCGHIYEGRAGGAAKAVRGAHTLGFNNNSMGIAVIGSYASAKPSGAALKAIARLAAWKLGLYGANPRGKTYLTSGGGNLYPKGKNVRLNVISGHRDGFSTSCPGKRLYAKLGTARSSAARYQGRR
ncbi:peptidoglycan recognition protein family protein [Streptomyces griseochromogenes]|uniref:N-acetylmuramoyl-L-alanine amidase n=2 Tax=Streptomyces griseochromogenes TaxID=68214 RepID=A0A1B1B9J2_9ACTN|nr:peptidoglycan recognition protein [Streptomyces griseochromogenes]ANP55463.1 N-acetylmuramoyl-L-alanine amidase [Streptomyces griseochromogenes]